MSTEAEKLGLSDGIGYELNPAYCRDTVTIASGQAAVTERLTVLGKITASGKFAQLNPGASDGRQTAAGICCVAVDAVLLDAITTALIRGPAIVNPNKLIWPAGITAPQKTTALSQLLTIGIKAGVGV